MLVRAEIVCSRSDLTEFFIECLCEDSGPILDRADSNRREGRPSVEEHPTGDQQPVSNVLKKCW